MDLKIFHQSTLLSNIVSSRKMKWRFFYKSQFYYWLKCQVQFQGSLPTFHLANLLLSVYTMQWLHAVLSSRFQMKMCKEAPQRGHCIGVAVVALSQPREPWTSQRNSQEKKMHQKEKNLVTFPFLDFSKIFHEKEMSLPPSLFSLRSGGGMEQCWSGHSDSIMTQGRQNKPI